MFQAHLLGGVFTTSLALARELTQLGTGASRIQPILESGGSVMSKNKKKSRHSGITRVKIHHIWENDTLYEAKGIQFAPERFEVVFGENSSGMSAVRNLVVHSGPGQGKSHVMKELVENLLIQHHGRTPLNVKPANVILQPPGSFLLRMAEFLFSPKDYERVFLPAVTDMREEYFAALSAGQEEESSVGQGATLSVFEFGLYYCCSLSSW